MESIRELSGDGRIRPGGQPWGTNECGVTRRKPASVRACAGTHCNTPRRFLPAGCGFTYMTLPKDLSTAPWGMGRPARRQPWATGPPDMML